jgi:putative addiction module antidote
MAVSALKLVPIGDSVGVIIPRDLVQKLGLQAGDGVAVTERPDGVQLSVVHSDFNSKLAVARRIMRERRTVLRELAK